MKSDFLATVSHELRTPVTVIEGVGLTLERTWDGVDDQTRKDLLKGLTSNARALDALITNLLDFSRLEAGRFEVRFGPLDLTGLLGQIANRLIPLFAEHPLVVEVDEGLVADADAMLIDRVVENLLTNAVKHTPRETRVRLSAHRDADDVVVAVADEGPGIAAEELVHLGERFFRGGDLNTRTRGLGLGLALAREALELHGSALEIESHVGEGSRFSFRLRPAAAEGGTAPSEALRAS